MKTLERSAFYHPAVETMSRDELAVLQLQRLKWQVTRCYRGSEFYRDKWRAAGLEPGDLRSVKDIAKLPFVTKQELREDQALHPPFGRYAVAPPGKQRELHPSSGTTGLAVNTLWTERDVRNITDFTSRTMWLWGTRPGDVILNGFSYGLWVAGLSVHYAARQIGCLTIPIGATNTQRLIDYLVSPGADTLICTPSYALHIAERLRERNIAPDSIRLRLGCFGGEAGTENEATRRKIEKGLGINAFDYYGLAEVNPTLASECSAKKGIHWTEDHHLVEVIDPDTKKPCRPGQVGVLILTNLTREASPMVRYWTSDYTCLDTASCPCGRTSARSPGGIMGRADDLVIYRGTKFYPVQVEKVVRSHPALGDEFLIELSRDPQTLADTCTVVAEYVQGGSDIATLAEELKHHLREDLLVTPEVKLVPFGTLERTTFKAKRVVDRRKE